MQVNKAYEYRIYPTADQKSLIHKTFGCVRFVYNTFLGSRVKLYEESKQSISYNTQAKELPILKTQYEWLKEVDSTSLQNSANHLDVAFKNFFSKRAKFPKFKSKKHPQKSYSSQCVNHNIRLEKDMLQLPKLGKVRVKLHRNIPENSKILSATIKQTATGKYLVSISVEFEKELTEKPINTSLGLDFAMDGLYVDSMGEKTNYPYFYYQAQQKLRKASRKLSRMKLKSNNWYKQKCAVAKIHERVANARKDYLHKLTKNLAYTYDMIGVEDLNMQGMSKALKFGKKVHDNAWGMFLTFLNYKLLEQGKQLIKIDKWFPSTKTCSHCGAIREMQLSDRVYRCECGFELDRDHNSALNIKNEALRLALN